MVQMLDKLKVKNVEAVVFDTATPNYKGSLFAGYTELGHVTTDLNDVTQLEFTLADVEADLRSELVRRSEDGRGESLESFIKDLMKEEVDEQKTYALLEVPRDYLRDYVKDNPDAKYHSFAILYVKKDGSGSVSILKTSLSTQDETIDGLIKRSGLENKDSKQATKILGFHYVTVRKIVTTEIA